MGYDKCFEHPMHQTTSAENEFSVASKLLPERPLFCRVTEFLPERSCMSPATRLGGIHRVPLQGAFEWVVPGLRSAPSGTVQAQPEEYCLDLQGLLSLMKKCKSLQKARE